MAGQDIKVDVAALLGSPDPPGIPVATVLVSRGARVVVDNLRRFGVQPVTLSMATWRRWSDGTHHGTPLSPDIGPRVEGRSGQRLQLRRIVDALRQTLADRGAGAGFVAAAARRLAALPDAEPDQLDAAQAAMRTTKAAALSDVQRLVQDPAASTDARAAVDALTAVPTRYEQWLARLSPP